MQQTAEVQANVQASGDERAANAHKIVTKYMLWSMGIGVLPFPLIDIAAIGGVQIKMLHELTKIYNVPFSRNSGKACTSALLGSIGADSMSRGLLGSLIKSIPVVGSGAGAALMPIMSGGATYAIGKVFIQHFESGGTFLDFDPKSVKAYFQEKYAEGKNFAAERTVKKVVS